MKIAALGLGSIVALVTIALKNQSSVKSLEMYLLNQHSFVPLVQGEVIKNFAQQAKQKTARHSRGCTASCVCQPVRINTALLRLEVRLILGGFMSSPCVTCRHRNNDKVCDECVDAGLGEYRLYSERVAAQKKGESVGTASNTGSPKLEVAL